MSGCMPGKVYQPLHVFYTNWIGFKRITLNCLNTIPLSSTLGGDVKDEQQKCHSTEGTACKFAM